MTANPNFQRTSLHMEQDAIGGRMRTGEARVKRLFVLDDELNMCLALERVLSRAGYEVRYGHQSDSLYRIMPHWQPDVIVLDVRLGSEDGRDVARHFRALYETPILMLTGQIDVTDRVRGLESGADDYLCKPYEPDELVARIRALLRRPGMGKATHGGTEFPVWVNKDERMLVSRQGEAEHITELQANIMGVLLEQKGRIVDRETLYSLVFRRVWAPGDRSLDVHISNLRKVLARVEPSQVSIQSIRNVGYRLVTKSEDKTSDDSHQE